MVQFETKLQKCIRKGIIIFKVLIRSETHFTAPVMRLCKTKFTPIYLKIYRPK